MTGPTGGAQLGVRGRRMVRVLRVSSMPFGVLVWVRPVPGRIGDYVMYVSDAAAQAGIVPPWKTDLGHKGPREGGA